MGMAAVVLTLGFANAALAQARLTLSTGMAEPWTTADRKGFTDILIPKLFKRLNIDAELVVNKASGRAITLADDGVDDGIAARVEGLEAKFSNLVRVQEPIFINDFVACGLSGAPKTASWDSIAPYRVSYIIGWQIFDKNLKPARELLLAKDAEQLFALLKAEKVDLALHERWQALWQARQSGLKLVVSEPPLARVPMFIYLNRKHAALAPELARELAAMKADGSYQAIAREAFKGLGQPPRLEP
ncbi:MAG: transporter substrate-binding domain-containing protein [Alphaproteobacteria bacterium]|nr:transporter substrate-binding domain-containing protein [Alphaproteobacteria bacterium]